MTCQPGPGLPRAQSLWEGGETRDGRGHARLSPEPVQHPALCPGMQVISGLPVNGFIWSNLTLGEGMRSETQDPSFSGLSLPSHQPLEGWRGARTPTPGRVHLLRLGVGSVLQNCLAHLPQTFCEAGLAKAGCQSCSRATLDCPPHPHSGVKTLIPKVMVLGVVLKEVIRP